MWASPTLSPQFLATSTRLPTIPTGRSLATWGRVFEETSAHEEEDLRRFLSGDDLGQSRMMFEGSANPRMQKLAVMHRVSRSARLGHPNDARRAKTRNHRI
jgi:hypothetical protein